VQESQKILQCFGETSVEREVWAKLEAQGDRIDRFRLLEFQATLGQEAEVISKLLTLLGDEDWEVRYGAAEALGKLAKTSEPILPRRRDRPRRERLSPSARMVCAG
jgi:hypothetical protein